MSGVNLRGAAWILLALGLVASPRPALAGAPAPQTSAAQTEAVVRENVTRVAPTQMQIGVAVAQRDVDTWKADAQKRGLSFHDYAEQVLQEHYEKRPLPAIIDPRGKVRVLDGHHRVWALIHVQQETGVRIDIPVHVETDYTGWSEEAYAKDLVEKRGYGLFTPEVSKLSPVERVRALPSTFAGLQNDPLRSAVGQAFDDARVTGSNFENYIEFTAGDKLLKRGLLDELKARGIIPMNATSLPAEQATDPRVVAVVGKRLFDSHKMEHFLHDRTNPETDHAAHVELRRAGKLSFSVPPRGTAYAPPPRVSGRSAAVPFQRTFVASARVAAVTPPRTPAAPAPRPR